MFCFDGQDDSVLLDSGIIYYSSEPAKLLLELAHQPIFSYTPEAPAVRVELYTDLLFPMNPSMSEEEFEKMDGAKDKRNNQRS